MMSGVFDMLLQGFEVTYCALGLLFGRSSAVKYRQQLIAISNVWPEASSYIPKQHRLKSQHKDSQFKYIRILLFRGPT